MSPIPSRLQQLRVAMQQHGFDAVLIPSSDPHLSEYLPAHWQGREYFSGFTGSVATLIVTQDFAGCWVDSRYWSQAENELKGTGVTMMKTHSAAATVYIEWLVQNLPAQAVVSVDGKVLGLATARALRSGLEEKNIVFPSRFNRAIRFKTSLCPRGSSPKVASSNTITCGLLSSAQPSPKR